MPRLREAAQAVDRVTAEATGDADAPTVAAKAIVAAATDATQKLRRTAGPWRDVSAQCAAAHGGCATRPHRCRPPRPRGAGHLVTRPRRRKGRRGRRACLPFVARLADPSSAVVGFGQLVAQSLGSVVAGALITVPREGLRWLPWLIAVTAMLFVLLAPEPDNRDEPREARSARAPARLHAPARP
ncbi:hypothetical protein [Streptomyces sp. NBC_00076]|uniref:hypothetical protein n=1 Tax=Streptomyces sp. NBC_00076 TaxID=2975642 RepID=UPI0032519247